MKELVLPSWYSKELISNPLFFPNLDLIQAEAYRMRDAFGIKSAESDSPRIFRFHVDTQACFTNPLTSVDPFTGIVTRFLPPFVAKKNVPEWWFRGNNKVVWLDATVDPSKLLSISSGQLSVAGAWNDIRRAVEWDLKNTHRITHHGSSVDFHQLTSRFDLHYYEARFNNPYGLPVGAHPYFFMDGPDKPFPIITPENLWHPEHNPKGFWEPIVKEKKYLDEAWYYTKKLGIVVLWSKHGHRFTPGGLPEAVVYAAIAHHNFMRGLVKFEPLWFAKGESWRFEFFGAYEAEYNGPKDEEARDSFDILNLFVGFNYNGFHVEPFDWIIFDGEAASHCLIKTLEQEIERLIAAGREDLIKNMICLMDCSSPIIGFEAETKTRFERLAKLGLRLETTETLDLEKL